MDPEAALTRALENQPTSVDADGWPIAQHARQLAEALRAWQRELDRREAQLHAQLAGIDHERRANRLWLAKEREALAQQEAALAERERQIAARETASEELTPRFRSQRAA